MSYSRSCLIGFSLCAITSLLFVSFSFTLLGDGRILRSTLLGRTPSTNVAALAAAAAETSTNLSHLSNSTNNSTANADSVYFHKVNLQSLASRQKHSSSNLIIIKRNSSTSSIAQTSSNLKKPQLIKRPKRIPPAWLQEGNCMPPNELSLEDHSSSAVGSFLDEKSGEQLLGDCNCNCPLKDKSASFSFDCSLYDWRTLSDLAPWHGVIISHAAIDLSFKLSTGNIPPVSQ
jgi:hypothetical protein